ncbi:MAG: AAA family ATPase [Alkalibacterium sp.]|nr:AAA family ATPase [Alkalibacterium sp.]
MDLILIAGPQAVGKMTVGHELEKRIDATLLFNHETIDLFAKFLGFTSKTFQLSEKVRRDLFEAFVSNPETNVTQGIIFTVVIGFDQAGDWDVLQQWCSHFLNAEGSVYFIELEADVSERLKRNTSEYRLKMKPSKRDTVFSNNELLQSMEKHRLNSYDGEVSIRLPEVNYLKLNNTQLTADETAESIVHWLTSNGYEKTTSPV